MTVDEILKSCGFKDRRQVASAAQRNAKRSPRYWLSDDGELKKLEETAKDGEEEDIAESMFEGRVAGICNDGRAIHSDNDYHGGYTE